MTSAAVRVEGVRHSYGDVEVLHGIDLDVEPGAVMSILGQSGCGKSTLLRIIAGFERPDAGSVSLSGEVVAGDAAWVPPQRRPIGYMSQDGSLFPHLSVKANLEFGLPRGQRGTGRAEELLEIVSLDASYLERWPHELSGGQQQRVALARTMSRAPGVVLLDEPFTALDADLRAVTRRAVAATLREHGVTAILVTHDQSEALSFSDALAVMVDGRFTQVGSASEVYEMPVDIETAALIGGIVVLPGRVDGRVASTPLGDVALRNSAPSGPAEVMVRPEQLVLVPDDHGPARIRSVEYYGHDQVIEITWLDGPLVVRARASGPRVGRVGERVRVEVSGSALAFPVL